MIIWYEQAHSVIQYIYNNFLVPIVLGKDRALLPSPLFLHINLTFLTIFFLKSKITDQKYHDSVAFSIHT